MDVACETTTVDVAMTTIEGTASLSTIVDETTALDVVCGTTTVDVAKVYVASIVNLYLFNV